MAVLTDGDPDGDGTQRGEDRVLRLLQTLVASRDLTTLPRTQQLELARTRGLFVGAHTCETDLFRSGAHHEIAETLRELAPGGAARARAQAWGTAPHTLAPVRMLQDITRIRKGRFAQRLSTRVTAGHWPNYMREAVEYVRTRCR